MAFEKGKSGNPQGREAGSKNKRTEEWEDFGRLLLTKNAARASRVLDDTEDEKFIDLYIRLLEFFKPKMNRTTIEDNEGKNPFAGLMKVQIVKSQSDIPKE